MSANLPVPTTSAYIGRFAPSPTGPLHFGSLIAAVGSYLRAGSKNGQWLLRIEDLDPPREIPGAADQILRTLEHYGFEWDGDVVFQSDRHAAYQQALEQLIAKGDVYPCCCTRKDIMKAISKDPARVPGVYPGTCRNGLPAGRDARSLRLNTETARVAFSDGLQGHLETDFDTVGDFVLKRADGLYAYQLAVVVDDADAGVTEIVRGSDLLDSTPRQILVQQKLGLPTPDYVHLPVVNNRVGEKLSKQTHAAALPNNAEASIWLWRALWFLDQHPPQALLTAPIEQIWDWAMKQWELRRIQPILSKPADHFDVDCLETL